MANNYENPFMEEFEADREIKAKKSSQPSKNSKELLKSEPKQEIKTRGRPRMNPDGPVEDKTYLYRTNSNFYSELQIFARISGLNVNTLIDLALNQYLTSKENVTMYNSVKEMVKKTSK